jgi:hypothetical protein
MCRGMSGSNSRDDQTGSFGEGSHQQIEVEIIAVECMAILCSIRKFCVLFLPKLFHY